jgi:hypothetical protein
MAAMKLPEFITRNPAAKLLSLAIAIIFWFSVTAGKETVRNFSVPIRLTNIPPGLHPAGTVPGNAEVTVAGPGFFFLIHPLAGKVLTLDLRNTGEGSTAFPDLREHLGLPEELRVIRMYPSSLELKLERKTDRISGLR